MTNFEFFKDTILEMASKYQTMAVVRDASGNGYIGNCAFTRCRDCLLDKPENESCIKKWYEWLYKEYEETPTLTKKNVEEMLTWEVVEN